MEVTVKFLTIYRHSTGIKQIVISIPDGGTLGDLLQRLKELIPQLFPAAEHARFIVNQCIGHQQTILNDRDQILMIEVLAGG